jgi:colanic acid/amylovoran biosynthesis glycosyltransferase
MEALSAGVPVIATDVGGVAEAVDAAVGQLLPADPDAATVAAAIEAVGLGLDAARRDALRDTAFARWAERFDARHNHAAFGEQIAGLMRRHVNTAAELRPPLS